MHRLWQPTLLLGCPASEEMPSHIQPQAALFQLKSIVSHMRPQHAVCNAYISKRHIL